MQETNQDVGLENNEEVSAPESQDSNAELEISLEEETQDDAGTSSEQTDVDWKKEALKYKAILERQNKKKAEPKKAEVKVETPVATLTREEAILIAKGLDEKDLDTLNAVAKAKGITLSQAKDDELFVAYQEKKEKERKNAESKLGASKGASVKREKSPAEMTPEEHKAYWKKSMGI